MEVGSREREREREREKKDENSKRLYQEVKYWLEKSDSAINATGE